jgi:SAM-dependent methyltransferase
MRGESGLRAGGAHDPSGAAMPADHPSTTPPPGLSAEGLDRAARAVGDDWVADNPWAIAYYRDAEAYMAGSWRDVILPFLRPAETGIDFAETMDLAAGHGRNAAMLLPLSGHLHIVDIQPANIEACRRRFGEDARISYHVTNGWSLPVGDAGLSFLYCWDAMVHFDSDVVRAYVGECRRALRPGGHAFLHHSNHTGAPGRDFRQSPHQRNFMSQALMAHMALKEGLEVVRQQPLDWAWDGSFIDCLTLLRRPA